MPTGRYRRIFNHHHQMFSRLRKGSAALAPAVDREADRNPSTVPNDEPALKDTGKSYWGRRIPVIACGAGLFADGYLNSVCGSC